MLSKRRSYFVNEWINAGTVELTRARWDWLGIQERKRRRKGMKQGKWWVQSHVKFVIQLENSGADILISQFDDIMTGNLG